MDAQELSNLQEAYMDVYYELDERAPGFRFDYNQRHGRPFITPETSQSASETETLGGGTYRRGKERLPKSKRKYDRQVLSGVRAASDQEKERARKRMGIKEDIYDIILLHLLDEGYAETPEAAETIMVNMSEEWREDIVEAYVDYRKGRLPSGRTPQTALRSGIERAKVNASRENRASGYSKPSPSFDRSKRASYVGHEMDAHTGIGGKINKALSPGLGDRSGASPRVAYGEPNTRRHQGARYRRGQSSTTSGNSLPGKGAVSDLPFIR